MPMWVFFGGLLLFSFPVVLEARPDSATAGSQVVALTNQGIVVGSVTEEAGIFRGIPYSQPPTGYHRWKDPRDPIPFTGKYFNATYNRPGCLQICKQTRAKYTCPHKIDEDCLYLNIWVPRRLLVVASKSKIIDADHYVIATKHREATGEVLSVMVFIHGGGFNVGAGSATLYDGRYLASVGDVIVVTLNYRLGAMGFLVEGHGRNAARGNYGIKDQIKALEWVRHNIRYFGGGREKVTVFGQSAGAESIAVLMTRTKERKLFHRAIIQSYPFGLPFRTLTQARKFGGKFARLAGCRSNKMSCLRKVTPSALLYAFKHTRVNFFTAKKHLQAFQRWGPVIDGGFIREQPINAFTKGHGMRIPTIMGSNVNEGFTFVSEVFRQPMSSFTYRLMLDVILKRKANQVIKAYPPKRQCFFGGRNCDNRKEMSTLATDFLFLCPERYSLLHMNQQSSSWMYVFNQSIPAKVWGSSMCSGKVCHGVELPFVFGTAKLGSYSLGHDGDRLSSRMLIYWSNFAKYGNPNGNSHQDNCTYGGGPSHGSDGTARWPPFRTAGSSSYEAIQLSGHGDFVMTNPYQQKCNFWDRLDAYCKY